MSSEVIKLLEKILLTFWQIRVFFQLRVVTSRLVDGEFPVDCGSGLGFRAKYRSLA
jgi:hypothetical protein